jgi:predicted GH43/DUF377 family glycosyl hydrolase
MMPDPTRAIIRPFAPGGDPAMDVESRAGRILSRILALSEAEVATTLSTTKERFAARHVDLLSEFEAHFAAIADHVPATSTISKGRRLLIGAFFTEEYTVESAALSNPSIVASPDQDNLAPGELRFVLSLRAIGEGHVSSIEFRSGVIDAQGHIVMEPPTRYASTGRRRTPAYDKPIFRKKLLELGADNDIAASVLDGLPDSFTLEQLERIIDDVDRQHGHRSDASHATRTLHWLASSNYETVFRPESTLSERVLFPAGPTESRGMEDARFVRFAGDDGTVTYFAPYTAYDGYQILPQLIETTDFLMFRIATLNGASARNKGIALFPRLIDGRYAALSRQDNENNFLMFSDNVRFWDHHEVVQKPTRPWEVIQLGNCGSPLETEAGWVVITHGVGPMRQYALGAILLDKDDPARLIGHLAEPLLEPADDERDGYVPNVVYSCGSMISNGLLVLPYGFSDVGTRIATVRVDDLLAELTRSR